jgi:hypothetical protein
MGKGKEVAQKAKVLVQRLVTLIGRQRTVPITLQDPTGAIAYRKKMDRIILFIHHSARPDQGEDVLLV